MMLALLVTSNAFSTKLGTSRLRSTAKMSIEIPKKDSRLSFDLGKIAFSLLPLSPESVGRRKTILTEVVKDQIWTLDQIQGIINVNVPVRSTIIKLKDGLFVNNPVAPTKECIDMVKEIEKKQGMKVKYITLASLALEHKGTSGAFSSYFPSAAVYVQPVSVFACDRCYEGYLLTQMISRASLMNGRVNMHFPSTCLLFSSTPSEKPSNRFLRTVQMLLGVRRLTMPSWDR
jgi:hypothetical protein